MRRTLQVCLLSLLATMFSWTAGAQSSQPTPDTETPQAALGSAPATADQVVDRIIAQEEIEVGLIRQYSPIVETYLQEVRIDKDAGTVPRHDAIFLGQADLSKGAEEDSMLPYDGEPMKGFMLGRYNGTGFLRMIYIDPHKFDRQHYHFDYVGREFLGGVRCVVFDVTPLPKSGKGRFRGRIWAEDQKYFVVRFNGVYSPYDTVYVKRDLSSHFDSWRANVQPDLWLP